MFFKDVFSKNSKSPVLQLLESCRTEKGPRKRVVVSLGTQFKIPKQLRKKVATLIKERLQGKIDLFEEHDEQILKYVDHVVKKIQTEGKWNSARMTVSEFNDSQPKTAEVFIDDVEHGFHRQLGPLLIGDTFWKRLNFPEILSKCGFSATQIKTAQISILNRLISQDSENGILPWLKTVAMDELLDIESKHFGRDRFYRISDQLLKNQEHIEKSLYHRQKDLFDLEDCIFLYDLTNTYFEGVCSRNPKAQYSKNQKEKRSDCPQVVVALVLDGDGFIRRHRVFNGKMSDSKSLKAILKSFSGDFKDKPMPTIVFDRGMETKDTQLRLLQKYDNLKYIVMCNRNDEDQFIETFRTEEFTQIPGRKSKQKVEILMREQDDVVYLLCKSDGRKEKERAIRNSREKKLEIELRQLDNQIRTGRERDPVKIDQRIGRLKERYSHVSHYYQITYSPMEYTCILTTKDSITKRLFNSLSKLQEKIAANSITFPALEKKLSELQKKYPQDYQQLKVHLKTPYLFYGPIDEIRAKQEGLEGNYLLKTNRTDLKAEQIWKLYMMLVGIEEAFRNLKTYLGLRPNWHHKSTRVDGHIFESILAYHLLHAVEHTLRKSQVTSRWTTIKRVVGTHQYCTIQLPTTQGTVINVRKPSLPEAIHMEIYDKLAVNYSTLPTRRILA